jgi:hypothetical protein
MLINDAIIILANFLNIYDVASCRLTCKLFNRDMMHNYFKRILVNMIKIHNKEFINFVNHNGLSICVKNVRTISQLEYLKKNIKLPASLIDVRFEFFFNELLYKGDFPKTVERLDFNRLYYTETKQAVYPPKLKYLTLGISRIKILTKYSFPLELQTLIFPEGSISEIHQDAFPQSLTHLNIDCNLNTELKAKMLPLNLHYLNLPYYNYQLHEGIIPSSLKILFLGSNGNQKLYKNILPFGLIFLKFNFMFNQEIESGALPETLEELIFSDDFNKELNEYNLPHNLKKLTVNIKYEGKLLFLKNIEITYISSSCLFKKIVNYKKVE